MNHISSVSEHRSSSGISFSLLIVAARKDDRPVLSDKCSRNQFTLSGQAILHLQSKNRVMVPQMNLKFPYDMKAP